MLYEIARAVATRVHSKGCPLPVVYGPEPVQDVALTKSRIVFERPRDALSDVVSAPRTQRMNPPLRGELGIAGVVRIYAQSTVDGARVQDHEEVALAAVDQVIVALQAVVGGMRTTHAISQAGLVSAATLALPELRCWPGVVYEIHFTAQHGVRDTTWAGDAKATQSSWSIETTGTCTTTAAPDP